MWEIVKEYIKPVAIVVAGVLGARFIEGVGKKAWQVGSNAATNVAPGVVNIAQSANAQAGTQANVTPPATPPPTGAQAEGQQG